VIAVSSDRPKKLRETLKEHGLSYTLLSDSRADGARAFGIAWKVPDDEVVLYRDYGIDLEEASGEDHHILPVPSVFLIDREGVIRFRYFNPDYKVRIDNDRLLEAARRAAAEQN
jgi:peroxiredoxin